MGETVEIDLGQLRAVADRVMSAAERVVEIHCPTLDPDDLPGSSVGNLAAPALVAARLGEVVATMRRWAVAAQLSADAFERVERSSGERFAHQ